MGKHILYAGILIIAQISIGRYSKVINMFKNSYIRIYYEYQNE